MIVIDDKIVSDDIKDHFFLCDLSACKGACCVEGDAGAPVEEYEIEALEAALPHVIKYLPEENKKVLRKKNSVVFDIKENIHRTPLMKNHACVYAIQENGIVKCGIEKAWKQKETTFRKPISCHLYPIRIHKYEQYDALNYEQWNICKAACANGEKQKMPLYRFLKDALIRKYGQEFYDTLVSAIEFSESSSDKLPD